MTTHEPYEQPRPQGAEGDGLSNHGPQSEQNQGRVESTTDASMAGTAHSWW